MDAGTSCAEDVSTESSAVEGSEADLIFRMFRGRSDVYAKQVGSIFNPVEGEVTRDLLDAHLKGEAVYGVYLITEDDKLHCTCFDIDNHGGQNPHVRAQLMEVVGYLEDLGLPFVCERSSGGHGAHVWLFWDAVDAPLAYSFMCHVRSKCELRKPGNALEIYPKQPSRHVVPSKLGNLVRWPKCGESCFIDPYRTELPRLAPQPLPTVVPVGQDVLQSLVDNYCEVHIESSSSEATEIPSTVIDAITVHNGGLLGRRWHGDTTGMKTGDRSSLCFCIIQELLRCFVPPEDVKQAMLWWCNQTKLTRFVQRESLLDKAIEDAYKFLQTKPYARTARDDSEHESFVDLVADYQDKLKNGTIKYYSSGVPALDASIGGYRYGQLTCFVSPSGHGKSSYGIHLLDSQQAPTLYIDASEENDSEDLIPRINARHGFDDLQETHDYLINRPPIYYKKARELEDIVTIVNEYRQKGVMVVVIDYFTKILVEGSNEYSDLLEVSQRLKELANTGLGVVLLAQMSKSLFSENWKRDPSQADISHCKALYDDAGCVVFGVHAYELDRSLEAGTYLFYPTKARGRWAEENTIKVKYDVKKQEFRDWSNT